jgi:hypothetical protein
MEVESKTGLDEVEATDLGANQKKIEAVGETIGVAEGRYGGLHLAAGCLRQLKKRTQGDDGPWHEFAATVGRWTRHSVPALRKGLGRKGPGEALGDGIMDQGMEWQLLLGSERTL